MSFSIRWIRAALGVALAGCSTSGGNGGTPAAAGPGTTVLADGAVVPAEGGSAATGSGAGSGVGGAGSHSDGGSGASDGSIGGDGNNPIIDIDKDVESIEVQPATVTIDVNDGKSSDITFKVVANYVGGGSGEITGDWTTDRADLGAIVKSSGVYSAVGDKGGEAKVTVAVGKRFADGAVTVKIHLTDDPASVPKADKDKFKTPDATSSGKLLYPYDKTVFARGILAPEIMWEGGAAGDSYKISIIDKFVDLTAFVSADPPSRWLMSDAWWSSLTKSSDGDAVQVAVQRMSGGAAHAAMESTWFVAPGNLSGAIYYWAVSQGAIVKINPGKDAPVPAFDPGAYTDLGTPGPISGYAAQSPPWDNQGTGKRCVACHTVSRDGTKLVADFSAEGLPAGGSRPWGLVDTAKETVEFITDYETKSIYSALSPDGGFLVYDTVDLTLRAANPSTGAAIATPLDALTKVAHPQFSGDGKMMAFVSDVTGGWPIEMSHSDLGLFDFDQTTPPHFSNQRKILDAGTNEVAFPSFTPDSKWILYQRGDYSRATYGAGPPFSTGYNDIYMIQTDGTGEVKLDQTGGAATLGVKDLQRNYQPRVAPLPVGGYFWFIFVSPRDYGNRMQSTTDSTNENRKQLWVAAVDADPKPGTDPSHPAFWLRGQDLETINMDAYWVLEPCKGELGSKCADGFECCTGFCRVADDGELRCVDPPEHDCSKLGEACDTEADCCPVPGRRVECIAGVCAFATPK